MTAQLLLVTPTLSSVSHSTHMYTQVVQCDSGIFPHTAIADLSEVNMLLKNVNNWLFLGLELGIFYSTLKKIEEEQHGAIDKCRTEMLAAWLQQDDNTAKKIYPRLGVLKTALGNIGENNLKKEIEQ